MLKRIFSTIIAAAILLPLAISVAGAEVEWVTEKDLSVLAIEQQKSEKDNKLARAGHSDGENVRIMVKLAGEPALQGKTSVKSAEKQIKANIKKQKEAISVLEQKIGTLKNTEHFYLLFNGFSFDGTAEDIDTINATEGMLAFSVPEYQLVEPAMTTSSALVGAPTVWETDYTGKGMVIAIVDTGILATHEAFSVTPSEAKYNEETLFAKVEEAGELLHANNNIDELYKSGRIPFGYNYVTEDCNVAHTYSDHGTHVAGIAAGNNGEDFKGIAYDAQLVVMNVFKTSGGAEWDHILAALEDCATLGVDSVNMSLGAACGSSSYADEAAEQAFTMLANAGVLVAAASGNDTDAALGNRWGGYQLSENPDMGLTSTPGTYYPSLCVASSDNRDTKGGLIKAYDITIDYFEPASGADKFYSLVGEHEFYDCGIGNYADIPDEVAGGIALIKRGDITFTEKAQYAAAKGAIGVIVYNNTQEPLTSINVTSEIPFVTLSGSDGEFLVNHASGGKGKLEIISISSTQQDEISSFSTRGTTSDLKIKPEITAPGGTILSAVGSGNMYYGYKSGTSMATPHVAGGMVLVKEYVKSVLPDLSGEELAETVNSLLMSSAKIIPSALVTMQGAGIMDLSAAISASGYLTVNGGRPKIELDESEEGKWDFSVEITNITDAAVTYQINEKYMIRETVDKPFEGDYLTFLTDTPRNVKSLVKTDGETSVTVEAGKTATLRFSLDASAVISEYGEKYPNGVLLEGFVTLTNGEEVLSAPLLGYIGDWDKPSMFDRGYYWQLITGELNLHSNGNPSCSYNYAGTQRNGQASGLGFNPFMSMGEKFNPDWAAINPDGNGTCDSVSTLRFGVLRNAKEFTIDIVTPSEVINEYTAEKYDFAKDFLASNGYTYTSYPLDYTGDGLAEGETAYITLTATLDHEDFTVEGNECAQWVIPVTLDTLAPRVYVDEGTICIYDEHYVSFSALYDGEEKINILSTAAYFPDKRGEVQYIQSADEIAYILVGDYAGNTAFYKVNALTGEVELIADEADNEHTLIYKVGDSVYHMERLHTGDAIVLPENPTIEGHTFICWDKEIPEMMPDYDIIVNAVFEVNRYTVTFNDWDGTLLFRQQVEYGKAAQAPENPIREGYTFTGWDKDFSYVTEDITVTAQYDINTYTVTFYDMDKTTVIESQSVEYGKPANAPTPPEHEGYTFEKWDSDFSEITSDLDVYALYTINTFTVTFYDMDMQTVLSKQTVEYGKAAIAPDAPSHEGWLFDCWSEDFSNVKSDLDVYAVYKRDILLGDVNGNGKINTADAVLVLKYSAEMIILDCTGFTAADVNRDDKVNTADAVLILKYAAEMLSGF